MTKTNYLLCPGDTCPIRSLCYRHQDWLNDEDDESSEMEPAYDYENKTCERFMMIDYYGG